ncbi:MAG TPA: AEC family transporter [Halanaerobiales bacterium]|nr:AEC family transporter [Halanaerobiales bacterium]
MAYNIVISQILSLFLLIFLGYVLRKMNFINEKLNKGLSRILVDVALPALIISSMMVEINRELINYVKIFTIITAAIYLLIIILSEVIGKMAKLPLAKNTVFKFILAFGNVGYMGIPIITTLFPENGIIFNSINLIFFNVLVWTYGVYLFNRKEEENYDFEYKSLLNNGVIAIIIGFFLLFTGLRPPSFITGSLEMLGNITFPVSMLVIGSSLVNANFKKLFLDKKLILLTIMRLILYPILTLLALSFFDLKPIIYQTSVILVAMPAPAQVVLFAEKFDGDCKYASEGVFITTLFSVITIPFFLYLLTVI